MALVPLLPSFAMPLDPQIQQRTSVGVRGLESESAFSVHKDVTSPSQGPGERWHHLTV